MDSTQLLITAMAEKCRVLIREADQRNSSLPLPLRPAHLVWMCDQIEKHAEDWPVTKLHRWIGFIQCAMMANHILDLEAAKAMFNKAKVAFGDVSEDLVDHLDMASGYRVDIGGQG